MDTSVFNKQILKTGFALEHATAAALRKRGWTVITNKYYIDDNEDSVKEIDLVAYKVRTVKHFRVYTTLIISCKKSASNVWALLARDLDRHDPNRDLRPLHVWSNDKVLAHQISDTGFPARYHEEATGNALEALAQPELDVFAFQEMNCKSGAPQNDRAIFSSITSLMKAQSYELNALPSRKTDICVYQFSLLSVVDAELVRIAFGDSQPQSQEVESESYIASYIIKRKEAFAKIRFLKASIFSRVISEYDKLHEFNCTVFGNVSDEFYEDVLYDQRRIKVLLGSFTKRISHRLRWRIYQEFNKWVDFKEIDLTWQTAKKYVAVEMPLESKHIQFLNSDADAKAAVADALADIYRYSGSFAFEDAVPF